MTCNVMLCYVCVNTYVYPATVCQCLDAQVVLAISPESWCKWSSTKSAVLQVPPALACCLARSLRWSQFFPEVCHQQPPPCRCSGHNMFLSESIVNDLTEICYAKSDLILLLAYKWSNCITHHSTNSCTGWEWLLKRTLQSKTSPESRAVLPLPKSELPMENHWISEKVAENTCHPNELSSAKVSKFVEVGMRPSEVKAGWLQFEMLRSCCGEDRCQTTGGDVFLAYLDGQQAPKALMQPSVHDFGNGSYALLLPKDTMLPTGTYKLSIYLHQALNRSAYRSLAGKTAAWPVADVFGRQNVLDPFDLQASSADLRAIYVHLKATTAVPTSDVHWQWPGGNLTLWKSTLSQLPTCHQSSTASKREGGFWLELEQHAGVACSGGAWWTATKVTYEWLSKGILMWGWHWRRISRCQWVAGEISIILQPFPINGQIIY